MALHHHSVFRPALGCQGVPMPPSQWHTVPPSGKHGTHELFAAFDSPVPNSTSKYVPFFAKCVVFWVCFRTGGRPPRIAAGRWSRFRAFVPRVQKRTQKTTHFAKFIAFFKKSVARFDCLCNSVPVYLLKGIDHSSNACHLYDIRPCVTWWCPNRSSCMLRRLCGHYEYGCIMS